MTKAKKPATAQYRVLRGHIITGTPGNETRIDVGGEIELEVERGARLAAAGDVERIADPAPAAKPEKGGDELPKTLKPVDGREEVIEIPGAKETVTMGQLLAEAFAVSGLKVADWNAQSDGDIEAKLKAELDRLAEAAAA